jgi:hypothetical protein
VHPEGATLHVAVRNCTLLETPLGRVPPLSRDGVPLVRLLYDLRFAAGHASAACANLARKGVALVGVGKRRPNRLGRGGGEEFGLFTVGEKLRRCF